MTFQLPRRPADSLGHQPVRAARVERSITHENAWYRLLAMPVLAALACGIGPFATGAPLSRSIGIGLTFGVTTWLVVKSLTLRTPAWPEPPGPDQEWGRSPRRWEMPGMEGALDRPQHMSRRLLAQQREIAEGLLARRGLDIGSAQARDLLGARVMGLLTDSEAKPPSRAELTGISRLLTDIGARADAGVRALPIPAELTRPGRPRRRARTGSADAEAGVEARQYTDARTTGEGAIR